MPPWHEVSPLAQVTATDPESGTFVAATMPSIKTVFVAANPNPVMDTDVPTGPEDGLTE